MPKNALTAAKRIGQTDSYSDIKRGKDDEAGNFNGSGRAAVVDVRVCQPYFQQAGHTVFAGVSGGRHDRGVGRRGNPVLFRGTEQLHRVVRAGVHSVFGRAGIELGIHKKRAGARHRAGDGGGGSDGFVHVPAVLLRFGNAVCDRFAAQRHSVVDGRARRVQYPADERALSEQSEIEIRSGIRIGIERPDGGDSVGRGDRLSDGGGRFFGVEPDRDADSANGAGDDSGLRSGRAGSGGFEKVFVRVPRAVSRFRRQRRLPDLFADATGRRQRLSGAVHRGNRAGQRVVSV